MTATKWLAAIAAAVVIALASSPADAQLVKKKLVLYTGAAGDTTDPGMADSTGWKGTSQFQRMYLFLKPSRPCRVAIAVYQADTSVTASIDTTNTAIWPWSGARESAADSLSMRETVGPTSVVAASYEMIYEFPAAAAGKWGSPRGRYIAIHSPVTGEWATANMTRIRLRVLSASGTVTWTAALYGYAW